MDWIRRSPKTAAVAGVVAVVAVLALVYLMASSSGGTPGARTIDDLSDQPSATAEPTLGLPSVSPSASAKPTNGAGSGTGLGGLKGLSPGGGPIKSGNVDLPGLPGGTAYQYASRHRITLKVTSQGPIGTIGYYIPYSPDKQSGTLMNVGTSWSLRTVSYGDPDYARIYLRAGGNPAIRITCTISVDGRVVTQETTDGPYALLICQG